MSGRAVVPAAMPALPPGMTGFARSLKRAGGVYHAHALGVSACGAIRFDRHRAHEGPTMADLRHWGLCPRCAAMCPPAPPRETPAEAVASNVRAMFGGKP